MMLAIVGQSANQAVKIRLMLNEEQIADGFVTLEQWDDMRDQLNGILEEDNPIWVTNIVEYEASTGAVV